MDKRTVAFPIAVTLAMLVTAPSGLALASQYLWVGPASGNFSDPLNWFLFGFPPDTCGGYPCNGGQSAFWRSGGAPGPLTVNFNGGTYTNYSADVDNGRVITFDLGGGTYNLNGPAGSGGGLEVSQGGSLTVHGGTMNCSFLRGHSTLRIGTSSIVNAVGAVVSSRSGSAAALTVAPGSRLSCSSSVSVSVDSFTPLQSKVVLLSAPPDEPGAVFEMTNSGQAVTVSGHNSGSPIGLIEVQARASATSARDLQIGSAGLVDVHGPDATLTVNQPMTVSSGISISAGGTLRVRDGGRVSTRVIRVRSAGNFEIYGGASATFESVQVDAGGRLAAGAAEIGGSLQNSGIFAPGTPLSQQSSPYDGLGSAFIAGAFSQSSTGTLEIQVAESAPSASLLNTPASDVVAATGAVTLGGALQITLIDVPPPLGTDLTIISGASIAGSFATVSLPSLSAGRYFEVIKSATNLRVVLKTLCPVDVDASGAVDFDDITTILANWLNDYSPGTGPGDANNDGLVNFDDITSVLAHWLDTCP